MFAELNKKKWSKDTEGFEFLKLNDYLERIPEGEEKEIVIYGYVISTKGKYGDSIAVIADDCFVNIPSWNIPTFKGMSEEQIEALDQGKCKLINFREVSTNSGKTIAFDFADV